MDGLIKVVFSIIQTKIMLRDDGGGVNGCRTIQNVVH